MTARRCAAILLLGAALAARMLGSPAAAAGPAGDLFELDLLELPKVRIASFFRRDEELFSTPAAVASIDSAAALRSGTLELPDALRSVPGLQVHRIDAHRWAVGSRGFTTEFANKLLVLVDGRSVYSPTFGGVLWDELPVFLPDLQQIDVIRGPGAASWGANAVQGVIQVLSRHASDTQGLAVEAISGSEVPARIAIRVGARIDDDTFFRVYAGADAADDSSLVDGAPGDDSLRRTFAGFRADGTRGETRWTLAGEGFVSERETRLRTASVTSPVGFADQDLTLEAHGAHLRAHLDHTLAGGSVLSATAITSISDRESSVGVRRPTVEAEVQFDTGTIGRHRIVAGAGYRWQDDQSTGSTVRLAPDSRVLHLLQAFVQDDVWLLPDVLRAYAGIRVEYDSLTGKVVPLPTLRTSWFPATDVHLWAAASRASRIPDRQAFDLVGDFLVVPPSAGAPLPTALRIIGDPDASPETVDAFEIGLKTRAIAGTFLELSLFHNRYQDLIAGGPYPERGFVEVISGVPAFVVPVDLADTYPAEATGAEASLTWEPKRGLRFVHGASWTVLDEDPRPNLPSGASTGFNPALSLFTTADWEFSDRWSAYGTLRWFSEQPASGIPSFAQSDLGFTWRPASGWSVSLHGRNLLHPRQEEIGVSNPLAIVHAIERSVFLRIGFGL